MSTLRLLKRTRAFSSFAAKYPATQITTLPNGIRVATEASSTEAAAVGVWVDTGSRYETERTNGVAHFLEHICFKGTARRSRRAFEQEVEDIGGQLNAHTSREQTVFHAKVLRNEVPQALDILADMVQNFQCTAESVEQERGVILREMEEVEKQMEEVIFDRLHETAFRGTSLGRTILGPVKNIETITRQDILDYYSNNYVAPRIVIAGAGAVDHGEVVKLSEKLFGNIPSKPKQFIPKEPAQFTGSDIRVRFDSYPEAHIAYAFPVGGWHDPDSFTLLVIQEMIGALTKGGTGHELSNAPLVKRLAEDDLAKSLVAFNTLYSDIGLFGIYATSDAVGQEDLMYLITEHLTKYAYGVDELRMQDAKNSLKLKLLAQMEDSTQVADEVGRHLLTYQRRVHPVESLARIDAVDANAIKRCANRYLYDRDFALAAVGPIWELPDYNFLRRRTYFLAY